jgi:hypothetical protein
VTRIAGRIQANQQYRYVSYIQQAWGRYFLSGWFQEKLEVTEYRLERYAEFVLDTTRKRLEQGFLKPEVVFKDKTFEQMVQEIQVNTLRHTQVFEEYYYTSDGEGGGSKEIIQGEKPPNNVKYSAPTKILRKPATDQDIVAAEERVGRPLPDDLKQFYSITNGTRRVACGPFYWRLSNRLPKVQDLEWEEEAYMTDYGFNLIPWEEVPLAVDWPGIAGGGISMYEHDGQGTRYVWYIQGELLNIAKQALNSAYETADEKGKEILDELVVQYHGSWERLKSLDACWYQHTWGMPEGTIIFYDFRSYLSHVLHKTMYEKDKSPFKENDI